MRPQNRKIIRRDHEAVQRLRPMLRGRKLRDVARELNVNPGSISQVMNGDVYYCAKLRQALGLETLPSWKHAPGIPLTHISGGQLRQCPDCIEEYRRGDKLEADTWHWFNVANRKRCVVHARARRNAQRQQEQRKEAV